MTIYFCQMIGTQFEKWVKLLLQWQHLWRLVQCCEISTFVEKIAQLQYFPWKWILDLSIDTIPSYLITSRFWLDGLWCYHTTSENIMTLLKSLNNQDTITNDSTNCSTLQWPPTTTENSIEDILLTIHSLHSEFLRTTETTVVRSKIQSIALAHPISLQNCGKEPLLTSFSMCVLLSMYLPL